jgi:hypothetical protein
MDARGRGGGTGQLLRLSNRAAVVLYLIIDVLCLAMGMGIPVSCILLGFATGWYLARRAAAEGCAPLEMYRRVLRNSVLVATITFCASAGSVGAGGA